MRPLRSPGAVRLEEGSRWRAAPLAPALAGHPRRPGCRSPTLRRSVPRAAAIRCRGCFGRVARRVRRLRTARAPRFPPAAVLRWQRPSRRVRCSPRSSSRTPSASAGQAAACRRRPAAAYPQKESVQRPAGFGVLSPHLLPECLQVVDSLLERSPLCIHPLAQRLKPGVDSLLERSPLCIHPLAQAISVRSRSVPSSVRPAR